jgi:hypothetical protein
VSDRNSPINPAKRFFHLIEEGVTWTIKELIPEDVLQEAIMAAYHARTVAMAMSPLE